MPLIIPVSYLLQDDMVLFRTDAGSKPAAIRGAPVAFEGQTPLLAWAPGAEPHYVRVNARLLNGRRISLTDVAANWWG